MVAESLQLDVDRVAPEEPDILTGLPRLIIQELFTGDSTMKYIKLTQGKYVAVDNEDYEKLAQHEWEAIKGHATFYAVRRSPRSKCLIRMHRVVTNAPQGLQVDHKNNNGLDNQKGNLRLCSCSQNKQNGKPHKNTSSKYKGVSWHESAQKWQATIGVSGKSVYLGIHRDERGAALAYDEAAQEYFGEYAWLNSVHFPKSLPEKGKENEHV